MFDKLCFLLTWTISQLVRTSGLWFLDHREIGLDINVVVLDGVEKSFDPMTSAPMFIHKCYLLSLIHHIQ